MINPVIRQCLPDARTGGVKAGRLPSTSIMRTITCGVGNKHLLHEPIDGERDDPHGSGLPCVGSSFMGKASSQNQTIPHATLNSARALAACRLGFGSGHSLK